MSGSLNVTFSTPVAAEYATDLNSGRAMSDVSVIAAALFVPNRPLPLAPILME